MATALAPLFDPPRTSDTYSCPGAVGPVTVSVDVHAAGSAVPSTQVLNCTVVPTTRRASHCFCVVTDWPTPTVRTVDTAPPVTRRTVTAEEFEASSIDDRSGC